MVRRGLAAAALALAFVALAASSSAPTNAASMSFVLDEETVVVTAARDGGAYIAYHFEFSRVSGLDGVDVGLPNKPYQLGTASATVTVAGVEHSVPVRKSPYVLGVSAEFDPAMQSLIQSAGGFQMDFEVYVAQMVYKGETDDIVGMSMRPTWFSESYQSGPTGLLNVTLAMPAGGDTVYYDESNVWHSLWYDDGAPMASWEWRGVSPTDVANGRCDAAAGFQAHLVDKAYDPPKASFGDHLADFLGLILPIAFVSIVILVNARAIIGLRRARVDYFNPEMSAVGAGPRRDLTAVEAAIVLERPLDKVATMVLFGLISKGKVEIVPGPRILLRKLAETSDRDYENVYLKCIGDDGAMDKDALKHMMIALVRDVTRKMKGFDVKATQKYYKSIADRAWDQVTSAGTPQEVSAGLCRYNDWMMLDNGYDKKMERHSLAMPYFLVNASVPAGRTDPISAANYVNSLKAASSALVGDVTSFAKGVTKVTNPVTSSGGGGGGGGGCACACACACAGGGR